MASRGQTITTEERRGGKKESNKSETMRPRMEILAIYLFRRAPRFPFMTTVKFTPRMNNELNPFFSPFQPATNPCVYITCVYIYVRLNEFLIPRYVQLFPVTMDIMAVGRLNGREETERRSAGVNGKKDANGPLTVNESLFDDV